MLVSGYYSDQIIICRICSDIPDNDSNHFLSKSIYANPNSKLDDFSEGGKNKKVLVEH